MGLLSIHDHFVQQKLVKWFEQSDELFVHIHYPHGGTSGFDYFVSSIPSFEDLVNNARPGAVFFVLRERQFLMRGNVDDDFVRGALESVKDGDWYRIVQGEFYPSQLVYFGSGDTHQNLRHDLNECHGMDVYVGPEPVLPSEYWNWDMNADDKIVIAIKPDL